MKLPNVDEELILELLGIAYTNDTAASIPGGDVKIRLAFPTSAMFSHGGFQLEFVSISRL